MLKTLILSLLLVGLPQAPHTMSALHSNDFEDGLALSDYGYTRLGDLENTSGAGVSASWGVRVNPVLLDPTGESFTVDSDIWDTPASGNLFRIIAWWANKTFVNSGGGAHTGSSIIEAKSEKINPLLYGESSWFIRRCVNANLRGISFNNQNGSYGASGTPDVVVNDALTEDVPAVIRVDGAWSTVTGGVINSDGWIKVYIDDVLVIDSANIKLGFKLDPSRVWGQVEFFPYDDLDQVCIRDDQDAVCFAAAPVVPPMQRASYVLFSNEIVEKQVETRMTRCFLQLLVCDPPGTVPPVPLTLTHVTGNLYDQQANIITTGRLYITPQDIITLADTYLISAQTAIYEVTGPIDVALAPSSTVRYTVEYDPDPSDPTPRNLKAGYFKDEWLVTGSGPIDIADL